MSGSMARSRGLQDIRTHAGRAEEIRLPHQVLLRVAWLEMEKHRRVSERQSAVHRMRNIEQRVKEIETEQQSLLEKVPISRQSRRRHPQRGCDARNGGGNGAGFKIRY